jgi:beta-phosphoglucomutase-like phosphatase (HAD superfamily)
MLEFDSRRYDAVIFDCDGTLVDSMPLHHEAWCSAFQKHGAPFEFTWDLFVRRAGMTLENTVLELNREYNCNLDPTAVVRAQRISYLARQNQIKRIEFVTQFAQHLRGTYPLAVASGSDRESVTHSLSHTQILDWFDVVVTANDVQRGKPEPDVFLVAAKRMNVAAERCLVVEDGLLGIEAAKRANMDAYLITRDGDAQIISHARVS